MWCKDKDKLEMFGMQRDVKMHVFTSNPDEHVKMKNKKCNKCGNFKQFDAWCVTDIVEKGISVV